MNKKFFDQRRTVRATPAPVRRASDWLRRVQCFAVSLLLFAVLPLSLHAQNLNVSGAVLDGSGNPIGGVSVVVKGSSVGVTTDANGQYSISAPASATLMFSFLGLGSVEEAVAGRTRVDVTLRESDKAIDEIVVVGYGTQKKVNLSGAVSTIASKTLENRPVSNANLALQGLAPGMNIQMSDSKATDAPDINIRGYTSINGGSAFILVDNVPVTPQELSRINPSDIESATVLKDAASAAIYGARAAFGVVLITTKKAKTEKLSIEMDANYGLRSFIDFPEYTDNIYEYMKAQAIFSGNPARFTEAQLEYARQRVENPSLPATLSPGDAKNPSNAASGNWEHYAISKWADILMKDYSPMQTYNVRVAQKGEKLSYAVSGGYYRQDGLMKSTNDVLKRYNFRGSGDYKVTKWWDVGTNISFVRRTFDRPRQLENTWDYYRVVQTYPYIPFQTPEGYFADSWIGAIYSGGNKLTTLNETQVAANTTINLVKDVWTVKADANYRFANELTNTHNLSYVTSNGPGRVNSSGNPSASVDNSDEVYSVYNIYTDFHKTFADKHFVLAMAGFNQEYYRGETSNIGVDNLLTNALPTINLSGASSQISKGYNINTLALRGVFARLNYIFADKYILELNGRYDGTSRYRKEDRFGFFPSGSVAWNLSNETFMKSVNDLLRINNLKLRGSYGALGNQAMEDENGNPIYYPYIPTMGVTSNITPLIDNSLPLAITQPGVVSGDLTWETVRTVNGGIDLSLFDNRFELNVDKYTRYTEGMLTKSKTLPGVFGVEEPKANAANLKTQGWELNLGWRDKFDLAGSPFSYSVRLMLADSRAYITKFDNPDKILSDYYEGQEIGEIWGYETLGYFASDAEVAGWADQSAVGNNRGFFAGDIKFNDLNNDGFINQGSNTVDDPGDRKIIGNSSYRLPYSIDLSAEWKGFDLRIFLQGIGKRQAYPPTAHSGAFFWSQYIEAWMGMTEKAFDNWDNKGDAGYFPRMKYEIAKNGELSHAQTKYLQDASFLRLKNLTLGYTLPEQLTGKWNISRLRVYLTGENLFTFHNMDVQGNDPERFDTIYYPFMKVISMGVNLSF